MTISEHDPSRTHDDVDVHVLALEKVGRILGATRARSLLAGFLAEAPACERLRSPADLYAFGRRLSEMPGMEQAVGALLTIQAVILGAPDSGESNNSGTYGRKL